MVSFEIFIAWTKIVFNRVKLEEKTVDNFTIYAKGFPMNTTKEQISEYFSKYGKTYEISIIYDFEGTLYEFKKLS